MKGTREAGALERGREAYAGQAWVSAHEALTAVQYVFSSMLVGGAGRDAEYVVRHLHARSGKPSRTRAATAA